MSDLQIDQQPIAVLHQRMGSVTQLGLFAFSLFVQPCIRISVGFVRLVRSPLAMKINTAIAVVGASRLGAAIFLLKALLAGPSLDQGAIHGKMLVR